MQFLFFSKRTVEIYRPLFFKGDIMKTKKPNPECFSIGKCFARKNGHCTILSEEINNKDCPFLKPMRLYSNGKYYPFNHEYEEFLKEKQNG